MAWHGCRSGGGWQKTARSRRPRRSGGGIARTKWIDDEIALALAKVTQLVLLGAGFDTRAYRLPIADDVRVFEVDHPRTSAAKQAVVRRYAEKRAAQVHFVEIDFNRQLLTEALDRANFRTGEPACFVWEGVTNYLTAEAVDLTLRQIAGYSAGSTLLFTYIHRGVLERPEQFYGAEKLMTRLNDYGEPWKFGLDPEELSAYLGERGWLLLKDLGAADVWRTAGRPDAEAKGYEFYRLVSARAIG